MEIPLFFVDFKRLVKVNLVVPESVGVSHSVLYFEFTESIVFYKPLGNFIYSTLIDTTKIDADRIKELIDLFHAYPVPNELFPRHTAIITGEVKF